MNISGLQGKSVERTIDGEIVVGKVVGGYMRGRVATVFVALRPSGKVAKWHLAENVRLSSMAIAEREGIVPGAKIATHDRLEQHARDVVNHCRNKYEGEAVHYAVVCWDAERLRWGMAASYKPGSWEGAEAVMAALFEGLFGE